MRPVTVIFSDPRAYFGVVKLGLCLQDLDLEFNTVRAGHVRYLLGNQNSSRGESLNQNPAAFIEPDLLENALG
jgi:hypothetical protein